MKSILLIIPYFGKWPIWFEAYLCSVARNPTVNWLCPTDCEIPNQYPKNITFLPFLLDDLNKYINNTVEAEVPLNPRKFCDLKPAYGDIFSDHIKSYDFWGFCDMDIVWGDIRKYITEDILNNFDIISSRKNAISGHFNLFRNSIKINLLYKQIPKYQYFFEQRKLMRIDEEAFTFFLKTPPIQSKYKIFWKTYLMNNTNGKAQQEYYLDKWLWKEGKMLELKNGKPVNEVMYLHFINWKRTMKFCEVSYADNPHQFYISYNGMHYQPHSFLKIAINNFKNTFIGYGIRMKRKRFLKRLKKKLGYYLQV